MTYLTTTEISKQFLVQVLFSNSEVVIPCLPKHKTIPPSQYSGFRTTPTQDSFTFCVTVSLTLQIMSKERKLLSHIWLNILWVQTNE